MRAYASESLTRPEIVRFRRRIRERYGKPPSSRVLVLLPCSARKPYSTSRSHRRFPHAPPASQEPSPGPEGILPSPPSPVSPAPQRIFSPGGDDTPPAGGTRPGQ